MGIREDEGAEEAGVQGRIAITHYSLLITHYSLPITHYPIPMTNNQ
ncbi:MULTISPECIES: hypothetical protein [unclassified Tolypothrix]|nr:MULTISPECIES: hypothetical protein [unclassified Tolypothrix]MBE9081095.1 hypothetical protein [Tolypothrix sp. LEGE 11397]UYD30241.1 hypothetical protein HGR01_25980 [Tolypothrix sp. PCC 7712]UYD38093.1 hypothetical protein HG267_28660 [Tolypothrix sp. PCC 7601]